MKLKAVFFDMGGTIEYFYYTPELRIERSRVIVDCLARAGIALPITNEKLAESITLGAAEYTRWNMKTHIELNPAEIWSRFYLKDLSIDPQMLEPVGEELSFLYETELFVREMRQEIPAVLEQIKQMGLTLGIISNTQSSTQVPFTLEKYGISSYFNPVVLSSIYGRRKPDPAIFFYAARMANVSTKACIYIGDKINRDVLGSKRAGYRLSVQINHVYGIKEIDEGAIPDAVIHDMTELIPLIEAELERDKQFVVGGNLGEIKAIFFDAGDILYYRHRRNEHLNQFLNGKKLNPAPNLEEEKARLKELAFVGKMKRHDYYAEVIRLYGVTDPLEIAEGVRALADDSDTVAIYDGVAETLLELKKRGFILGIITDTSMPFSNKLRWFEEHGFGDIWDVVISSREIGIRKPEAIMYELALNQANVSPAQAMFVGHKTSELIGARSVGMKIAACNNDPDAPADYYLKEIRELLTLDCLQPRNTKR